MVKPSLARFEDFWLENSSSGGLGLQSLCFFLVHLEVF